MSLGEYFNKDDITKMYDGMKDMEEFSGYQKMKSKHASMKEYSWEVVEQLYKMKKKSLDGSLKELEATLKPQGSAIYFKRKVELLNLLDEQRRQQTRGLSHILKATEAKKDDYLSRQVKKIMEEFDIKHPFRGEEFEDCDYYKQHFADKIQYKAADPKSFIGYKRDQRATLDQSIVLSEDHQKLEQEAFLETRMILRYRLFGVEGITRKEFNKLVKMGIIKKKENHYDADGNYHVKAVEQAATPKSDRKARESPEPSQAMVESEVKSGSVSTSKATSRASFNSVSFQKRLRLYEDNSKSNEANAGFKVQPLDPVIFGKTRYLEQKRRLRLKDQERKRRDTIIGAAELNENSGDLSSGGYMEESVPRFNIELTDTDNPGGDDLTMTEIDETEQSEDGEKPTAPSPSKLPALKVQESNIYQEAELPTLVSPRNPQVARLNPNLTSRSIKNRVSFIAKNSPSPRKVMVMPHLSKKLEKIQKMNTPLSVSQSLTFNASPVGKGMPSIDSKFVNQPLSTRHHRKLDPIKPKGQQLKTMTVPSQHDGNKSSMLLSSPRNDYPDIESVPSKAGPRGQPGNQFIAAFVNGQTSIGSLIGSPTMSEHHDVKLGDKFKGSSNYNTTKASQRHGGGQSQRCRMSLPDPFKNKNSGANSARNKTLFSPSTAFSAREFKPKQLESHRILKELGNGRINAMFTGKTPVQDPSLRPTKPTEPSQLNTSNSKSEIKPFLEEVMSSKSLRKTLDAISKNIDRIEKHSKADYKDLIAKMVSQNLRDAELTRVGELLKDIDFAEPEQIISIFEYRQNDEHDSIRGAELVVKEYHSGKQPAGLLVSKKKRKQ